MKVANTQPFQIIYSFYVHEFLGVLFEAYAVQVDGRGRLTFLHQHLSTENESDFSNGLDEIDYQLIKLTDEIRQDNIAKKHSVVAAGKKVNVNEFFLKIFDKDKPDKAKQELLEKYVEKRRMEILTLLIDKEVYEMGADGEPTYKKVNFATDKCQAIFHFMRNEESTHYFPRIKYQESFLDYQYKNAIILNNFPAYLYVNSTIYSFDKEIDGKKIKPFLHKKFIDIPRKVEETYFQKFVAPVIATFDVYAKGITIKSEKYLARPILTISEIQTLEQKPVSLFDFSPQVIEKEESVKILFELSFEYGTYVFSSSDATACSVTIEKQEDNYIFHKVKRSMDWEKNMILWLDENGVKLRNAKCTLPHYQAFSWLNNFKTQLNDKNFLIVQNLKDGKKFFLGTINIDLQINEHKDWFDVNAKVCFGDFEIAFATIRKYIKQNKREFVLPNGETAVIPDEWFTKFSTLFEFLKDENELLTLEKHHVALVQELAEGNLATVSMNKKLLQLKNFEEIPDFELPKLFKGELRPYQKAGYNWMKFLKEYKFGGCLADDMGLGKTVQTLALLQSEKENGAEGASLLAMPTSLLYNWQREASKFTSLKVLIHAGVNRIKDERFFHEFDIIITSYGVLRIDIDLFEKYHFNYVILDESQTIKNPTSQIAKEIQKLNANNRLTLSGTPIENSTLDLWSQMNFANPGLLGAQSFFKEHFLNAIEKNNDVVKLKKLHSIIKPFLLRRIKQQVAQDLPEKIESIRYCKMSDEQESIYEKVKSAVRNEILSKLEGETTQNGNNLLVLQALTKLRQLANHPSLIIEDYEAGSGKFDEITDALEGVIANGHKVLIFSQFVKHLAIIKNYLDEQKLAYCYLDGSTKDREAQVDKFQKNEQIQVFLISLKAGGVGLNLTAADTVFILDPWWNPAAEAQAVDRAHRIGQKNTVFTYKFITLNTVEEKILALQNAKLKLSQDLITTEESFMKSLSKADISAIFE